MEELLAIVAITAVTFVATSFDNLVLLIVFLGDAGYRWGSVVVGYVASSTLVTAVAWDPRSRTRPRVGTWVTSG